MNKRIDYLDIAKGLGILLVYIGHCNIGLRHDSYNIVFDWIYSFHMPFFFFVSGLLFNVKSIDTKNFLWKKTIALMLPYIISLSIISYCYRCSINHLVILS